MLIHLEQDRLKDMSNKAYKRRYDIKPLNNPGMIKSSFKDYRRKESVSAQHTHPKLLAHKKTHTHTHTLFLPHTHSLLRMTILSLSLSFPLPLFFSHVPEARNQSHAGKTKT